MRRNIPILLVSMTLAILLGCGQTTAPQAAAGHAGEAPSEAEEPGSHEGHAHGEEAGDLERPVDELMADECEHDMKTFLCDECRYEVGFVKVPATVAEGGLVTEATARAMDFRSDMALNGEIAFDDRRIARLGPREAGFVRRVNVVAGDRVKKGDVLIELESPMYAELTSEYLEASSAVQLAHKAVGWQDGLRAKSMTTEREFQEAATALESARIRLQSARLALKAAGLSESDAGRAASAAGVTMSIRAPFDGEVFEVNAVRGAHLDHDTDAVLMGDQDKLWVNVDLYERQIAAISAAMTDSGLPVAVTVDAWPGIVFEGRLDYLGGVMDRTTRTVKARVTINNVEHRLRAGMFATVRPIIGDSSGAVAVPSASVLRDADESFVFVRQEIPGAGAAGDRWYVRRPVKTGRSAAGFVEITEGLQIGQVIAADGAFLLKSDVLRSKMGEGCAH